MAGVFTELQKQKLIHMFELLDVDGNGVLEYDDFRMVVDTMAEERGWNSANRRYRALVASNRRLWKMISRPIDIDDDGSITLMEWLAFHIRAFVSNPEHENFQPEFSGALSATARFFCDMLDSDGDGKVSLDDYILFCGAYNVEPDEARQAFALFDRDGSGDITQEEVEAMVKEFYLSEDPNALGNRFFGSL